MDAVQGMAGVEKQLDKVADAADDISPTFDELGTKYADRENSVFDSNGWGRWAPRAPSTIAEGIAPLQQTGIMRDGITPRTTIWRSKHAAAFGAPKSDRRVWNVAVLHTAGTTRMPARMPVPRLRAAERRDWVDVVRQHMRKALR